MIQKSVFPERISIGTEKRQYLTSKVNVLFVLRGLFSNNKKSIKKGLPINSDEESFVVAGVVELSNLDLLKDIAEICENVR